MMNNSLTKAALQVKMPDGTIAGLETEIGAVEMTGQYARELSV